jgi:hypothetical protein
MPNNFPLITSYSDSCGLCNSIGDCVLVHDVWDACTKHGLIDQLILIYGYGTLFYVKCVKTVLHTTNVNVEETFILTYISVQYTLVQYIHITTNIHNKQCVCVCVCVCVCMRARVCVCVLYVRGARTYVCVRACVCMYVYCHCEM